MSYDEFQVHQYISLEGRGLSLPLEVSEEELIRRGGLWRLAQRGDYEINDYPGSGHGGSQS